MSQTVELNIEAMCKTTFENFFVFFLCNFNASMIQLNHTVEINIVTAVLILLFDAKQLKLFDSFSNFKNQTPDDIVCDGLIPWYALFLHFRIFLH